MKHHGAAFLARVASGLCLFFLVGVIVAGAAYARTWTASNGKTAEAEFVSFEEGVVRLKSTKTGKTYELPLDQLSQKDQVYVARRLAAQSEGEEPAGPTGAADESTDSEASRSEQKESEEAASTFSGPSSAEQDFDINVPILIGLVILNIPVYLLLGLVFFDGWAGFFESLKFWLTPDVFSLFRGEYTEDRWAEMKLAIFVACCIGAVILEYYHIEKFFL